MADAAVTVEFGAKTDEIDKGSAQVQQKLQDLKTQTDQASDSFSTFGEHVKDATDGAATNISKLSSLIGELNSAIEKGGAVSTTGGIFGFLTSKVGIAGLAIGGIVEGVHVLGEEFVKLEKHAERVNETIEGYERLQYVFHAAGVATGEIASGLASTADKLRDLSSGDADKFEKFLKANKVDVDKLTDSTRILDDYLKIAAEMLQKAAAEGGGPLVAKTAEALHISEELALVLQKGPVALELAKKKADDLGASLNANLVHRAAEFTKAWDEGTSQFAVKFKAMLSDLLPVIIKWANQFLDYLIGVVDRFAQHWRETVSDAIAKQTAALSASGGPGIMEVGFSKLKTYGEDFAKAVQKANKDLKETGDEMEGLVSTGKAFSDIEFPDDKKSKFDPTALYEFRAQLDEVKEKYQQLKITEQDSVNTYKITERQKVNDLRAALEERERQTDEIFAEELMKYGENAKMRALIERNFNKEVAQIETERLKLTEELNKKTVQDWQKTLQSITGAFNSQLRGLLAGTTTWSQAMKNITADLVIKMIEKFEELAIIKPLAGMFSSLMEAPAELFAGLLKAIAGMFGPLMAGFTSFFAPELGPAAPAAGAAAAAATTAVASAAVSLDKGTDYVPRTGLALIHQGERIIPASQNVMGGSGVPMAAISFTVQALDSSGVQAFFTKYGPQIAKSLSAHMNQNPTSYA